MTGVQTCALPILDSVLRVIYLVFNEGYSASSGEALTRQELSAEAIRLARLLMALLPESQVHPEVSGLLALMLLNESRRAARTAPNGDVILLEAQDRSSWHREYIDEGVALTARALSGGRIGTSGATYALQAAISAMHAQAASADETDWTEIAGLYDVLLTIEPSPVVELNRAVALAMRDGPEVGLAIVDQLLARGELRDYRLAHAARADLCRRLGRDTEARRAYEQALKLTQSAPERRFFQRRLAELKK